MRPPRVAYFPDSFHEVNGVAHTSRNFVAYAERHALPFLCVRAGDRTTAVHNSGALQTLELPRSVAAVGMEKDLSFDPLFWRHADRIEEELRRFKPDILHLTGPSELGIFAAYFAWKLKLPLAASWHTNVHEYAARRLLWLVDHLPAGPAISRGIEAGALDITTRFYSLAQILFAPNAELCSMLTNATGRPCERMQRGVDTDLFSPTHRTRTSGAFADRMRNAQDPLVLGYVGRLSVEKNVALLPLIQSQLAAIGLHVRFLIVGHGGEEEALRRGLPHAEFVGVLRGLELSRAYANMDLLVFPSHTDTFGNVVLEALASGVPAIVTPDGGPKFIVRMGAQHASASTDPEDGGETGVIVNDAGFADAIANIFLDPSRHQRMRRAARAYALGCSWDAVFDRIYSSYRDLLRARRAGGSATVSSPR